MVWLRVITRHPLPLPALFAALWLSTCATAQSPEVQVIEGAMAPFVPLPRQSDLEIAASKGNRDHVASLYKGALPQERASAFYQAVSNQHLSVVELMVDRGIRADLGSKDRALLTAAQSRHFAGSGSRHMDLVKLLCSRGFDPNSETPRYRSALHEVLGPSSHYSSDLVFALIDCGADPLAPRKEQTYRDGKAYGTASIPTFHDAVAHEDLKLVAFLLDKGVDVNVRDDGDGRTAFFHAQPGVEMVRLLLRTGADPNAVDRKGMSVLTYVSCHSGAPSTEAMRLLISAGARPKGADGRRSALLCAAETGSAELVEMLLSVGADPNSKDEDGRTVLEKVVDRHAAWTPDPTAPERHAANRLRIVRALLEFGADPELFEPRLSYYAWKDDEIGKVLGNALEQFYLKRVRSCIAALPTQSVSSGPPSEKPTPPGEDRFADARVERTADLGEIPEYAGAVARSKTVGGRLCGLRNDKGHLTGNLDRPELRRRVWALGRPVRYEFRHDPGSTGYVVMTDGAREERLVGHEEGWVRTHIKAWLKENGTAIGWSWLHPVPKDLLKMRFEGLLSPNDRYLYYVISAAGVGWASPPEISRHFVMDLQSGSDVWEIAEPVLSGQWHPNGRELLLRLRGTGGRGHIAVASFP